MSERIDEAMIKALEADLYAQKEENTRLRIALGKARARLNRLEAWIVDEIVGSEHEQY